jgi:hypothetical protein
VWQTFLVLTLSAGAISVEYVSVAPAVGVLYASLLLQTCMPTIERLILLAPAGFVTDPAIQLFNCCPW